MPTQEMLPSFYSNYHTHVQEPKGGVLKHTFNSAVNRYIADQYGYVDISPKSWAIKTIMRIISIIPTLRDDAAARVFWLKPIVGGDVLEVGFGSGSTLLRLKAFGWKVSGVEFDPIAVRIASGQGLDVKLGSLQEGKYAGESFDAVVSSHVLEHLSDPQAHLAECRRIMRPGGRLVVVTPNSVSLGHRLFGENWRGLEPPRHLQIFGPLSLAEIARAAGFNDIKVSSTSRSGHILSQSVRLALNAELSTRGRLEVEFFSLLSWLISITFGEFTGEELRLECKR
jgi:2-polyprenyl-3-methyl-5-hydroxy-6-metoxy-1,4-benzoquinol methylase